MTLARSDPRHGTANGYSNLKCRCSRCRKAWREYLRTRGIGSYRKLKCPTCDGERTARSAQCRSCSDADREAAHGTESRSRRCRCDECRAAASKARARRRKGVALGTHTVSHGESGYRNGCRCEICTQANSDYSWRSARYLRQAA